jgi:hypothetical protein
MKPYTYCIYDKHFTNICDAETDWFGENCAGLDRGLGSVFWIYALIAMYQKEFIY